jgi:hypothetical protein
MVSPNLLRRNINVKPAEINENAKRLFQVVYKNRQTEAPRDENDDDVPMINVSAVVSKLAVFYEKIRNVIDNSDDYLLRKNAIIRILKRKIVIENALKSNGKDDCLEISQHLITELIRGSYLPNNRIPETKIKEVAEMLEKYVRLKNLCVSRINQSINGEMDVNMDVNKVKDLIKEKNSLTNWILSLAACEIEESFNQNTVKRAMIANLYDFLNRKIQIDSSQPVLETSSAVSFIPQLLNKIEEGGVYLNVWSSDGDIIYTANWGGGVHVYRSDNDGFFQKGV